MLFWSPIFTACAYVLSIAQLSKAYPLKMRMKDRIKFINKATLNMIGTMSIQEKRRIYEIKYCHTTIRIGCY
ncbi:unnamed protein product [Paramecium octaurelia]|uniref:Secreted protein n=1 Tax=Paramecium octaurelia TaxID=43137 RepID=A0A8S1Y177_PAROT|nr:unnamed protein product [Paramecium octaurelia]